MSIEKIIREQVTLLKESFEKKDRQGVSDSFVLLLFLTQYPETCPSSIPKFYDIIQAEYTQRSGEEISIKDLKFIISEVFLADIWQERLSDIEKNASSEDILERLAWLVYELYLDIYLFEHRDRLKDAFNIRSWAEPGSRKGIVNAPMGLGKTYQIAEALAYSECSAVIFMPNKKLRDRVFGQIKSITDEVIKIEGLEESNCPNFRQITAARRRFRDNKKAFCDYCEENRLVERCETREQKREARKYRLVVTTHAQYETFYNVESLYGWTGEIEREISGPEDWMRRDLFVIDEDIVGSHFFDCKEVTFREFSQFSSTILDELVRHEEGFNPRYIEYVRRIENIIRSAPTSALILPQDKEFTLTSTERRQIGSFCGRALSERRLDKNISGLVENAIRQGCTYNKYLSKDVIYFGSASRYHLDGTRPFHLFFDATHVDDQMMNMVFPEEYQGEISRFQIDVKPLGKASIYHTWNSDVSKTSYKDSQVEVFCRNVINKQGDKRPRYYAVTNGAKDRDGYKRAIKQAFGEKDIRVLEENAKGDDNAKGPTERELTGHNYVVVNHFGNLRGDNKAKYCDIGLLIGKYKVPDPIEVVWALPYLQGVLYNPEFVTEDDRRRGYIIIRETESAEGQSLATIVTSEDKVKECLYRPQFDVINRICKWKRDTENEQAMGRTRYLYHDVVFYAVTKDKLDGYSVFNYPDKVDLLPDEDGLALFGSYKNCDYFYVKKALDELLSATAENAGRESITFKNDDILKDRINSVMRNLAPRRDKEPAQRTIGDHIKRYLDERYSNYTIGRYGEYTVFLDSTR